MSEHPSSPDAHATLPFSVVMILICVATVIAFRREIARTTAAGAQAAVVAEVSVTACW